MWLFNWDLLKDFLEVLTGSFWLVHRKNRAELCDCIVDISVGVVEKVLHDVAFHVWKHLTDIFNLLLLYFLWAHIDLAPVLLFNKALH
jgi:hypothetical protein